MRTRQFGVRPSLLASAAALALLVPGGVAVAPAFAADSRLAAAVPAGDVVETTPTQRTDYREVVRTLNTEIPALMQQAGIVGLTIALVDGDRVVMAKGFGDANRATGKRVTAETLFHIGSTSKTLAALAVMQLVERGQVDLDAPLARYVPEFELLPRFKGNVITVRSVLDHHSGIPGDVFNGLITLGEPVPEFNAWLVDALQAMYPERPVDAMWAYNNSGYVLLQNLVENISGLGFEEYAQENLFGPMGMTSSMFDDRIAASRDMTRNYVTEQGADGERSTTAYPREYVNGWPAGSVLSNADDMAKYLQAMLAGGEGENGRVLSERTLRQMWTRQTQLPLDIIFAHYGLGFILGDPNLDWTGEKVVWHNGATMLNFTMLRLLPEAGLGAYVSINTVGLDEISQAVADRAMSLAFTAKTGRPQPAAPVLPASTPVAPEPATLTSLAGHYAGGQGAFEVEATGTGLRLTELTGPGTGIAADLVPMANGAFRTSPDAEREYLFQTVEGKRLVLLRLPYGAEIVELVRGQMVPMPTITPAWQARLGRYVQVDAVPAAPLLAQELTLRDLDGMLVMDLSPADTQVLVPGLDGVAFTYGLGTTLGRGKGQAVVPSVTKDGRAAVTYLGVTYVRGE
jgi:CubicO group peptidase (beta-lactamase class C family)